MSTQVIDVQTVKSEAPPKSETALAVRPPESVSLFRTDDPQEVVKRATGVATALRDVIQKQGLISEIQGKKYPKCEAWTLCGTMLGIFPVLCWTHPIEGGWEARVEAKTRNGEVVGAAEAECLRSERNWSNREDFAIRSMAQTRATAKALRMPLGFIMTLAGYMPTPAEEMCFENDLGAGEARNKTTKPTWASSAPANSPGTSPAPAKNTEVKNGQPAATQAQKDRMLSELVRIFEDQNAIKEYAVKAGILLPTETLLDWPRRYVPAMKSQMDLLLASIGDFLAGDEAKKPFVNADPPVDEKPIPQANQPELKPATTVARDPGVAAWRTFPVPFGKNQGVPLSKLSENSLAWYCRNFVVETEYNGRPKRQETIAKDQAFRDALNAAAAELGIKPEDE